jgi:hypothetical protein
MKSIHKFVYAVVLLLSTFNFAPTLASAQEEGGRFTLPHSVLWQNVEVPAGEYRFSLQTRGPSKMLMLTKISGEPTSFMVLATNVAEPVGSEISGLVIDSRFGKQYVSAMNLPEYEIDLHFQPPVSAGKPIAQIHTASAMTSAR